MAAFRSNFISCFFTAATYNCCSVLVKGIEERGAVEEETMGTAGVTPPREEASVTGMEGLKVASSERASRERVPIYNTTNGHEGVIDQN